MKDLYNDMAQNGLQADHIDLQPDGALHRYDKDGSNNDKAEWYVAFTSDTNNYVYCTYGSWSQDTKFTYRSGNIPKEQRELFDREIRQRLEDERQRRIKEQLQAQERAKETFAKAKIETHPYLQNKKLEVEAPRICNSLVVPYYNIDGEIQTLQYISPEGEKMFMKGGKTKGCYHPIGDKADKIYICEGYATALTVHQATGYMTICAGSMHNINATTTILKSKHPKAKLYLCQDVGNTADKHAKEWKDKYQGTVYKPASDEKGYDFNDLYIDNDIEDVKEALRCNPFPLFLMSEIEKYHNRPISWIVPDQITENSVSMIHAKGGVGKSRLLYELMFALVERDLNVETMKEYPKEQSNIRWLEWKVPKVHKCLYIDTELEGYQVYNRTQEVVNRRKSIYNETDMAFVMKQEMDEYFNLYERKTREKLDILIDGYDVIFIDNLQNAMVDTDLGGDNKENDPKHWYVFFQWLKQWTRNGKTFILAHHTGKSGSYRGTSRQEGDVDNLIKLSYPHEHKITLQDEFDLAFVYEMEKGRDVPFHKREPFLAAGFNDNHKYGWDLTPLKLVQKGK